MEIINSVLKELFEDLLSRKDQTSNKETIKEVVFRHLKKNNSLVFGQCLSAVGWVGGTIPELTEDEGLVELSMADVSNGGIVVGAGLSNRRPIYVIRYQGFNWFNASIILNYASRNVIFTILSGLISYWIIILFL